MFYNLYLKQRGMCLNADTGAGGAIAGTGTGDVAGAEGDTGGGAAFEPPKSAEELASLIKVETDKALATAQESWKVSQADEISKAVAEANRISKLSAEDKEIELEKKRINELDQREATIKNQEIALKATDMLTSKGLPLDIRSLVIGKDEAETKERIETFEGVFQKAVEAAVNQKLSKSARPGAGSQSNSELEEIRAEINAGLNR